MPIDSHEDSDLVAAGMSQIQFSPHFLNQTVLRSSNSPAASKSATVMATQAGSAAAVLPAALPNSGKQAVNQSLQLALNQWQQQQASLSSRSAARRQSSQAQQLDGSRMEALKERIKNLRQMMMLVGKDKGGLRSIAMQLKQITSELRQMVASATGNDAQQSMALTVTTSGSSGAESTTTDSADGQSAQVSDDANANAGAVSQETPAGTAAADSGSDSKQQLGSALTADSMAGSGNSAALKGNLELQIMLSSIKSIQQWLKQRSQQIQSDDGLKKLLESSDKDMAAIDHMLNGGDNSDSGESTIAVQFSGAEVSAGSADSASGSVQS